MNQQLSKKVLVAKTLTAFTLLSGVTFYANVSNASNSCSSALSTPLKLIQTPEMLGSQFGSIDPIALDKLTEKYHMFSTDVPEDILKAFEALYNGHMTLSVFNKVTSEYPNVTGSVSAIVYKAHIEALHQKTPNLFSKDGAELINATFKNFKKSDYTIQETSEYYLIDIQMNGPKDAALLGGLGTASTMQPQLFLKTEQKPTNHFFKVPDAVFHKVHNKITDPIDNRLRFTNMLKEGNMTLDATNALIGYDGTTILKLGFHVSKARLAELKTESPSTFSGDQRDIELALNENKLTGKFIKTHETDDLISYRIQIHSKDDIYRIFRLTSYAVQGRIGLD